jgi:hypothetical protein
VNSFIEQPCFHVQREARSDTIASKKTGFSVTANYRINEIDAKVNGTTVTKYALGYSTGDDGQRSLMSTITETGYDDGGTATTLPATSFGYTVASTKWGVNTGGGINYNNPESGSGIAVVDVNGDGLLDEIHGMPGDKSVYLANASLRMSLTT